MQRPSSKYLECQLSSKSRDKRGLDPAVDGEDSQPEPKRPKVPALASVIVEALKVDSLQKLCSSLEPILRKVVSEEVERALAKLGPARVGGRSPPKQIDGPDGRNLQLHFRSRLSLPLFTGGKVEGEQGAAIHVVLLDANTGLVVTSGPESSAKLDIVVLEGDFNNEDNDGWTEEEFESHVVKEREGKRPLLAGDLQISLKEGVGTLEELTFTDNSSWIRSRKFRLGLKAAPGFCDGIRVREAKTEAFTVKDHRGELYKKHYPPALKDEVWRLEKIGKDGSFHKRLSKSGVFTVEDFLRLVVKDSQRLRNILGSGMSNKMWESLVEHAKTCVLSGKYYIYYADDTRSIGALFNNIYEFIGLIANEQYYSAESLADSQKVFVDTLVKRAYDNWMHAIEYDGKALLNFKKSKKISTSPNMTPTIVPSYPASYDQQASHQQLSATVSSVQPSVDARVASAGAISVGYNGTGYKPPPQHTASNTNVQLDDTSFIPQNEFISSSNLPQFTINESMTLALGPPQQQNMDFPPMNQLIHSSSAGNSYDSWSHQQDGGNQVGDDLFSEEEIRLRSHEMLENDDMQQLLRVFSMGGNNVHEDGYGFPSYIQSPSPNFNFDEVRTRSASSGKAVVGWLKIKKQPKPKAKDLYKREMTFEEKQKLGSQLQSLPPEKLDGVVQIIRRRNSGLCQQEDEIEVDIDCVDTETLWELDRFVTNYKKSLSKHKRKAELAMLAKADAERRRAQERVMEVEVVGEPIRENHTVMAEKEVGSSFPIQGNNRMESASGSSSPGSSGSDSSSSSSGSDSDSSSANESDAGH